MIRCVTFAGVVKSENRTVRILVCATPYQRWMIDAHVSAE